MAGRVAVEEVLFGVMIPLPAGLKLSSKPCCCLELPPGTLALEFIRCIRCLGVGCIESSIFAGTAFCRKTGFSATAGGGSFFFCVFAPMKRASHSAV